MYPGDQESRRQRRRPPLSTLDPEFLTQVETLRVSRRLEKARRSPIAGTFTFGHMRQIHQHLFQDIYAWAGEPRNVPMQKHGTSYAAPAEIPGLLREQYTSSSWMPASSTSAFGA